MSVCWSPVITTTPASSPSYRCWAPGDVTLAQLVEGICHRWRTEETFQLGKSFTGLDEGQVTCWNSWMRWSLFSLIASAALALTAAATAPAGPFGPARPIPLTCPELVRLLRTCVLTPPVRDPGHALHRMAWHRRTSSGRVARGVSPPGSRRVKQAADEVPMVWVLFRRPLPEPDGPVARHPALQ